VDKLENLSIFELHLMPSLLVGNEICEWLLGKS